ncbi:hypothetical protein [Ancylomarina longa]|uniref:Class 1 isoprenoid biosynthesis enzyme n=1 Tax=Ancylomarina longa TaxID=2487017 RepID=A0A434AWH4_9BACT|nr:hypothetical protein [Ancylomarina longa]RUT78757.1 hypothetical protein DLK05_06355 [Ancylomarina longa]
MIETSTLYNTLTDQIVQNWMLAPEILPSIKTKYSNFTKILWESKFDKFIHFLKKQSQLNHPDRKKLLNKLSQFFKYNLNYSEAQLHLLFSDDMISASKDFIINAWKFDPDLSYEEIFQALRNMWIIFGLQSLFGKKIESTPSLMAYSLLYPYTDNFLDDLTISNEEKNKFSERFALRLSGVRSSTSTYIEKQTFALVDLIEDEFNRTEYPQIYQSLIDIHDAQTKSIDLLDNTQLLSETDLLKICIRKGATSVIADGYLILGELSDQQKQLLFEYGAYLQILDDLQDANEDYEMGVNTCFSRLLPHQKLDKILCKTYYLGRSFLRTLQKLYPNEKIFYDLLRRSFGLILLASLLQNQQNFSSKFIQKMENHSPFRYSFIIQRMEDLQPLKHLFLQKIENYKQQVSAKVS